MNTSLKKKDCRYGPQCPIQNEVAVKDAETCSVPPCRARTFTACPWHCAFESSSVSRARTAKARWTPFSGDHPQNLPLHTYEPIHLAVLCSAGRLSYKHCVVCVARCNTLRTLECTLSALLNTAALWAESENVFTIPDCAQMCF